MPSRLPFAAWSQIAADLLRLTVQGGLTISTPLIDPIVCTLVQLDGDVVNHVDVARLAAAEASGDDLGALARDHFAQIQARLVALATAAAWLDPLPRVPSGLIPGVPWLLFWWASGFTWLYVTTAVVPMGAALLLRSAPAWGARFLLRLASRKLREELRSGGASS